ncbi:Sporulation protein [Wickerhamomyces ciferrii]|uniref:Sporulation protein n=1 Tax=Wickerhamomyces ciferrii (strain ATCC 14091 / BCRC 22168 / CBS 111 / JCM 3599 / NBRC 0793 / NRRL Y-1031 F-60-10) TaxID=1206466 RepID=K0KVH1_WICCF|nr:Sporulation protein [Wickerhamomyces ciferrii]CCH45454.1 Sporulation protein [Wickerhamomyces ciferrii]
MSDNQETTRLLPTEQQGTPGTSVQRNTESRTTLERAPLPTSTLQQQRRSTTRSVSERLGPQRLSRTTQKLKLLPDEPIPEEANDEGSNSRGDVYSQVNRIKDTPARRDAERLGKNQRSLLPRVTAYCTSSSYKMKDLIRWLKDHKRSHDSHPKLFDECLYTPFVYKDWRGDKRIDKNLIRLDDEGGEITIDDVHTDVFIFEYGVVVLWGFTLREEQAFLNDLEKFENEKLAHEDLQIEEFNYYITKSYQPRIYNDFITLRDGSNYMLKLSISHAISQSVKISLFEELVDNTIEDTQDIPQQIAQAGKVEMNKDEIMKSIGELFILRININLHGSVLDSPEIMWSEPHLEPIYQATRGYLEINQRVALLNQRLEVISDLLQMLKEQLGHSNEEYLEFIVIILVGVEVLVSVINIVVDIIADLK